MNQKWQLAALALGQVVVVTILGLEGDYFTRELVLSEERVLVASLLLTITLLLVTMKLVTPTDLLDENTAFVIPLHWSAFFQISILIGLSVSFVLVKSFDDRVSFGGTHTYEVAGLLVGLLGLLALTLRREWQLKAAFGAGYGLALPAVIMMLDRANNDTLATYVGILSSMLLAAAFMILVGLFVRIEIVD